MYRILAKTSPPSFEETMDTNESKAIDFVWEVKRIAEVIQQTERQTFNLLEKGLLPAKKIGGRWVASRQKLIDALLS
jgi:hypothetical protein